MKLHPDIERAALVGWHLYPCSRRSKKGCFKGASAAATADLDQLDMWQHEYRNPNWRVVCGPSRIWGLDLDVPGGTHTDDGIAAFAALAQQHDPLPPRPTTRSGGGGLAIFFRHDGEDLIGKTGYPAKGIDPRRGGLSVTVPPSVHVLTGQPYKWLLPPWELAAPPAPAWLLDLFRQPAQPEYQRRDVTDDSRAKRALIRAMQVIRGAPSGAGNDTLNRRAYFVARHVAAGALGYEEAVEALYAAALDRRIPRSEARDTIKSAFRSGLTRPLERV